MERRFPRVRGDGPVAGTGDAITLAFPPRARGWTLFTHGAPGPMSVSPACAGMDPSDPEGLEGSRRFPRVRGDGPEPCSLSRPHPWFPPRARGWTFVSTRANARSAVSPACAGMDPFYSSKPAKRCRFPRVRGDGPQFCERGSSLYWFPPRARGWTFFVGEAGGISEVSPACAGMDPWLVMWRRIR